MAETLTVNLGERSYPILFADSIIQTVRTQVEALRAQGRRVVAVTDRNVQKSQEAAWVEMFPALPVLRCEPGEGAKSMEGFARLMDFLAENRVDRTGCLFAVGG